MKYQVHMIRILTHNLNGFNDYWPVSATLTHSAMNLTSQDFGVRMPKSDPR